MVKNMPSFAGNVGLVPGGGIKIPHAMGQPISPCATITVPACFELVHCNNTSPRAAIRESLSATMKSLCIARKTECSRNKN